MHLTHLTDHLSQPSLSSVLVLLALVVISLAALYLLSRLAPTTIVIAGLVAEMFSGLWGNLGFPGPLDHFLLAFGLISMVLGRRRMLSDRKLVIRPVHFLILAIAAWAVGSAIWAGTFTTHDGFFALLDRLGLLPFTFYLVAPLLWGDARQRNRLLGALMAMGLYLGVTAMLEGLDLARYAIPSYIGDPHVGILYGRARGPYVESDADGLGLIMSGISAALGLVYWRSRWARRAAVLVLFLTAAGIIFTLTRAVWIAGALVLLTGIFANPRLRRRAVPLILGAAIAVAATIFLVPGLHHKVTSRLDTQISLYDRYNTNRAALSVVRAHPLTGIGWQRFPDVSAQYLTEAKSYPLTGSNLEVHNVFLSHAAELGLPGCLLWAMALLSAVVGPLVRRSSPELRPWRIALFAYATAFLVIANFGPLSYAQANLFMWVLAAIAGTDYLSRPLDEPLDRPPDLQLNPGEPAALPSP